jgi:hypothetical protein
MYPPFSHSSPSPLTSTTTDADLVKPFNLLLVPFPYRVGPAAFRDLGGPQKARWRWFGMEPIWTPVSERRRAEFVVFIRDLLDDAKAKVRGRIHGLIFPELALDWRLFSDLVIHPH